MPELRLAGGWLKVRKNTGSPDVGQEPRLNLIEGSGCTLTVSDDPVDTEIDVTIQAAGGGNVQKFVQEAEPTAPPATSGDFWLKPSTNTLYVRIT